MTKSRAHQSLACSPCAAGRERASHRLSRACSAWRFLPGGCLLLLLCLATGAATLDLDESSRLLARADDIKTANHAEFVTILKRLEDAQGTLPAEQQQYLHYLRGWRHAYDGKYDAAISVLDGVVAQSQDPTLRFRAQGTIVNVLSITKQYDAAFSGLGDLLEALPDITDGNAREQALAVIAVLHNYVGQHDLAVSYADRLIRENWAGRSMCKGAELKLAALYRGGRLHTALSDVQAGIEACVASEELLRANLIRTYLAKLHIDRGRIPAAIELLERYRPEVERIRYPALIAEVDSLLAHSYRSSGDSERAWELALSAIERGVRNRHMEASVRAYRVLYEVAREHGDTELALEYHEKYAAADKDYLDDVSARQLAYERVRHETEATRLQVEGLNQQNELLKLEQENARLYIALLILGLGFSAFWAYRTKRSQLRFMKLARVDGLTGIANRPHFIEQAEHLLENSRRLQQEATVVLCDLDHFKAINDQYGHATGDFVLKQVAEACRRHLRAGDVFGRFGGEEFSIVLAGCGLDTARERCEQLRRAIGEVAVHTGSMVSQVSASFGIATTGASGYELRQLLAHADTALYRAKDAGRDRVVLHTQTGIFEARELTAFTGGSIASGRDDPANTTNVSPPLPPRAAT